MNATIKTITNSEMIFINHDELSDEEYEMDKQSSKGQMHESMLKAKEAQERTQIKKINDDDCGAKHNRGFDIELKQEPKELNVQVVSKTQSIQDISVSGSDGGESSASDEDSDGSDSVELTSSSEQINMDNKHILAHRQPSAIDKTSHVSLNPQVVNPAEHKRDSMIESRCTFDAELNKMSHIVHIIISSQLDGCRVI